MYRANVCLLDPNKKGGSSVSWRFCEFFNVVKQRAFYTTRESGKSSRRFLKRASICDPPVRTGKKEWGETATSLQIPFEFIIIRFFYGYEAY